MKITEKVHCIELNFVNAFLIFDEDGLTLIDSGVPSSAKKIRAYIEAEGRQIGELKRIVLTHSDVDHMGGAADLKAMSGATVYASNIEADAIAQGKASREISRGGFTGVVLKAAMKVLMHPKPLDVDIRVGAGYKIPTLGGLEVIETPGHTPGHISLYARAEGILFAGDSMVSEDGRLLGSRGAVTWDPHQAAESVRTQAALQPRFVCVGHGRAVSEAATKFPVPKS